MPTWPEKSASVVLTHWNVVELNHKGNITEHFVGYVLSGGYARISTPIEERDENSDGEIVGRTKSGSTYQLVGPPGFNSDSSYMYENLFSKTEHKLLY